MIPSTAEKFPSVNDTLVLLTDIDDEFFYLQKNKKSFKISRDNLLYVVESKDFVFRMEKEVYPKGNLKKTLAINPYFPYNVIKEKLEKVPKKSQIEKELLILKKEPFEDSLPDNSEKYYQQILYKYWTEYLLDMYNPIISDIRKELLKTLFSFVYDLSTSISLENLFLYNDKEVIKKILFSFRAEKEL